MQWKNLLTDGHQFVLFGQFYSFLGVITWLLGKIIICISYIKYLIFLLAVWLISEILNSFGLIEYYIITKSWVNILYVISLSICAVRIVEQ